MNVMPLPLVIVDVPDVDLFFNVVVLVAVQWLISFSEA